MKFTVSHERYFLTKKQTVIKINGSVIKLGMVKREQVSLMLTETILGTTRFCSLKINCD